MNVYRAPATVPGFVIPSPMAGTGCSDQGVGIDDATVCTASKVAAVMLGLGLVGALAWAVYATRQKETAYATAGGYAKLQSDKNRLIDALEREERKNAALKLDLDRIERENLKAIDRLVAAKASQKRAA